MQDTLKRVVELLEHHPGKVIGALSGLLLGVLVIALGVLRALFLIACLFGGLYIGARIDVAGVDSIHRVRDTINHRLGR